MACLLELNDGSVKETSEERFPEAKIAQLGERMTEDHKVRCSIHLLGAFFFLCPFPTTLRRPSSTVLILKPTKHESHNC